MQQSLAQKRKEPVDNRNMKFYQDGAEQYRENTLHLDTTPLQKFLFKHIKEEDKVLELGFGSGREMLALKEKNIQIIGVDMVPEFVQEMKKEIEEVYVSKLPDIKIEQDNFDVIYSVAVLFHLNKKDRLKLYKNMKRKIKAGGKLLLSYNTEDRREDKIRYFDKLTQEEVQAELKKLGFDMIEESIAPDAQNRGWEWVTECYKLNS